MIFIKNASIIAVLFEGKILGEVKQFLYLTLGLFFILALIVCFNKLKFSVFIGDDCTLIPYTDGQAFCFGQDAGIKSGYETAETYCKKRNMELPTREQAWYVWIASENCQRAFASGGTVAKNKDYFINNPSDKVQAITVANYCNQTSSIKFSQALQYNNGYFWLKESPGGKLHYAVNYADGSISVFKDKINTLGIRCVR